MRRIVVEHLLTHFFSFKLSYCHSITIINARLNLLTMVINHGLEHDHASTTSLYNVVALANHDSQGQ